MGVVREARVPRHRSGAARGDAAHRVRDRAHRPPGPGRRSTCRRTCRTGELVFAAKATCRFPATARGCARRREPATRRRRCARFFACAGETQAAADLRRRRRDRGERERARCARSRSAFGIPVTTTLMGLGAFDTTIRCRCTCSACTAPRIANYAVDDCDFLIAHRRALRRSRRRRAGEVRARTRSSSRTSTSIRPRSTRSSASTGITSAMLVACAATRCVAYGRAHRLQRGRSRAWHAEIAELKPTHAMNYDRDSRADPAAMR